MFSLTIDTTKAAAMSNGVETEAELKTLQHRLARGTPFGDTHWQSKTAAMLGLESSLQPRGGPKK
jgi:hypothetical protein